MSQDMVPTDLSLGEDWQDREAIKDYVEPAPISAEAYFALAPEEQREVPGDHLGRPFGYWYWSPEDQKKFNSAHPRTPNRGPPQPSSRVKARSFVWRAPRTIPPRQWLYGQHYIRKFVSATIAAPGIGKSSLGLVEAIAMASGKNLLDAPVPKRLRIWYWNLEDPYEEIERRIAAILINFKIDPAEIEGQLFVNSGRADPFVIAEMIKGAVAVHAPLVDALTKEIIAQRVDVLLIDPFVSSHRVPENDNGAIDAVTKAWAGIAGAANCSIDLVHHVRKPSNGQAEFDVNDARGASALIGTVRAARVLNSMTKDDAEAAGAERALRRCDLLSRPAIAKHRMFERALRFRPARQGIGNRHLAPFLDRKRLDRRPVLKQLT